MFYWGIDWSADHHNLCIRNEAGALMSRIEFENSLSGLEQLEAERRKLGVTVSECLVAIETTHHLVVDYLLEQAYVVYIAAAVRTTTIAMRLCWPASYAPTARAIGCGGRTIL